MTGTVAEYAHVLTEFAVRDYLRTVTAVKAAVGNDTRKIDLDYSTTGRSTYLVMYRSGGAPAELVPVDRALLTFHCVGSTRHAAEILRVALTQALRTLNGTNLNDTVFCYGATVESVSWLPFEDGTPRYVVSSLVLTRSRQAA